RGCGPGDGAVDGSEAGHLAPARTVRFAEAANGRLKDGQIRGLLRGGGVGSGCGFGGCGGSSGRVPSGAGDEPAAASEDAACGSDDCRPFADVHAALPLRGVRGGGGTECSGTVLAHQMTPTCEVRYQSATK